MANTTIWQAVLGELEVSISKAHFETWLRRTKLGTMTDKLVVINVPNIFIRSWVESHYKQQFLASFQKHVATIEEVQFEIVEEGANTNQPVQLADELVAPTPAKVTPIKTEEVNPSSTIVRHQTFDTYVEGTTNRLASTVSRAVSQTPGTLYNPLFIYGGVGLGKTHLMHAIANTMLAANPKTRALYVPCEKFTNDYIGAIYAKKMDKFKETYRTVDLLLVDDVQFIGNKEGSQEEFFNTFNTLHQSNRQIVIAADRVPSAIPGLEERLSSRFGWGMIVDIQPPNLETRVAILGSKCIEKGVTLPDDSLEYIATQIQSNIRDLEGALNRVLIYCQMSHIPYSVEATRAALSGLITPNYTKKPYTVDTVLSIIAQYFGLNVADLLGSKRKKELVYPRHLAMFVLREELGLSFPDIGRELGGKDHTTAMHAHNKIAKERDSEPKVMSDLNQIKQQLSNV